jgi:hypothetical protein
MTFLNPWAIGVGMAAIALPLVIHWLTRPRPVRLPLSTVRFVVEAVRQRRAHKRLRDWIILAMRMLAVALLGWAVARPLIGEPPLISAEETSDASRVVILDVSQSMAMESGGIELLERARPLAADYLQGQTGLQANLILAGAKAQPAFDRPSFNLPALREELARAKVRPERLHVQTALNAAADLLAKSGDSGRKRELVVISDFQRSNWATADFSVLPEDTCIQLESVALKEAPANLAVLRVGCRGRVESGREVRLEIEVGNFSPTPRQVQVELTLGEARYRLEGLCSPGNKTTLATEVRFREPGWQFGEARLMDLHDALPADNIHPLAVEVHPPPTYALITRQPAELRPSSSYFLERALGAASGYRAPVTSRILRIDPLHLDREALASTEMLVLDHPGKLPAEAIQLMMMLLRRGRGILYVTGEPVDVTNLQLLADSAGSELQLPVEFAPPPKGQRRRDLFLTDIRADQPPFAVFGDNLLGLTDSLRFSGGLATRRLEENLADDILASYSDRSASLTVSSCGMGSLAVLNADLSQSNLPGSPAFVPLLGELTRRLLGKPRTEEAIACGEPVAAFLPLAAGLAAGLIVFGPDEQPDPTSELVEEKNGVLWKSPGLASPGIYKVKRESQVVFALAAAISPEEADLRAIDSELFQDRLSGGRTIRFTAALEEGEKRDPIWTWLAVGCVGFLLAEVLALKLFRT